MINQIIINYNEINGKLSSIHIKWIKLNNMIAPAKSNTAISLIFETFYILKL